MKQSFCALALAVPFLALPLAGCTNTVAGGGGGGPDGSVVAPVKIPDCTGACVVNYSCPAGMPTTIFGTVNIPSGNLPLYNAKVYIPTGDVVPPPPQSGATCERCDALPDQFAATTDFNGNFKLQNVPSGDNIPLIVRVGKWRRVIHIPTVKECGTTQLDPDQTRLPKNQTEGNIPRIALSTGNQDALECILRSGKLGLDDSEFTRETGNGRVNLYAGATGANKYSATLGGQNFTAAQMTPTPSWWDTAANMNKYDIIMLSCEGAQHMEVKSLAALQNLESYINQGGRVFASHWHNGWMQNAVAPQKIQNIATFKANASLGPITAKINTGFAKGKALSDWLVLPQVWGMGTPPPSGDLPVAGGQNTVMSLTQGLSQLWVSTPANDVQYISFNAPIGGTPDMQCGQMVFTDLHVSSGIGGDSSAQATPFPNGCTATSLSPQEKALIFMLFDLTNCLTPQIG